MELIIQNRKGEKFVVLYDEIDHDIISIFKWYYQIGKNRCESESMHRILLRVSDSKVKVDHINHNTLDNRRSNIRTCTHQQNLMNKSSWGTSKYLGVHIRNRIKNKKNYKSIGATIRLDNKTKHIGYYKTEKEAAYAYDKLAKLHFGEFANLNFK